MAPPGGAEFSFVDSAFDQPIKLDTNKKDKSIYQIFSCETFRNYFILLLAYNLMPYPCSHFYFDIKFGNRLYSKEKRRAWPLLF